MLSVAITATTLTAACGSSSSSKAGPTAGNGKTVTIKLWTHNGGNKPELAGDMQIVNDFNASQSQYKVVVQSFPQASYNDAVVAAASAKKLPCIVDIDGPNMPNWAWAGYLAPLDIPDSAFAGQLPSTIGKLNGKLYSFGLYEAALGMFAQKSALTAAGARIPTIDKPWTLDEFNTVLAKIKASGKYPHALDLGTGYTGEWEPYAYSPLLQSFGGDLINRAGYATAEGTLNGPKALAWAQWFRGLVTQGYIAQTSGSDATADFVNGKSAILYAGDWAAQTATSKAGSDVVILPPPDLGNGTKIGGASWEWGMTPQCSDKAAALAYLKFSLQTKYFVNMAKTVGLVPATDAARAQLPDFAPGGPDAIFYDMSQKFAVLRPATPAYPFISTTFAKAATDILAGGNAKSILDKAASDIDNNIKQNGNYSF